MKDIVIGVLFILFGIAVMWYTSKQPKNTTLSTVNIFQGYLGGGGFIFLS